MASPFTSLRVNSAKYLGIFETRRMQRSFVFPTPGVRTPQNNKPVSFQSGLCGPYIGKKRS